MAAQVAPVLDDDGRGDSLRDVDALPWQVTRPPPPTSMVNTLPAPDEATLRLDKVLRHARDAYAAWCNRGPDDDEQDLWLWLQATCDEYAATLAIWRRCDSRWVFLADEDCADARYRMRQRQHRLEARHALTVGVRAPARVGALCIRARERRDSGSRASPAKSGPSDLEDEPEPPEQGRP